MSGTGDMTGRQGTQDASGVGVDGTVMMDRAARVHEETAARHEAAAGRWDQRGEPARADFERRCAALEREASRIEAGRADLERLRAGWLERRDAAGRAEIERLSAEMRRRASKLMADDAVLEGERGTVFGEHAPAPEDDEPVAPPLWTAVERERAADRRERVADERERIADERERIADQREDAADYRERAADQREDIVGEPDRERVRMARVEARHQRERAEALRDQAAIRREVADSERLVRTPILSEPEAAGEPASARAAMAAERAWRHTRETTIALSSLLNHTAEALERRAGLAEKHAQRCEEAGASDAASGERDVAEYARQAAAHARSHAAEWLKLAGRAEAATPPDDTSPGSDRGSADPSEDDQPPAARS